MADRTQPLSPKARRAGLPRRRQQLNARRPGPITALDVDGQVLRLAQMTPRGDGMTVTRAAMAPLELPPGSDHSDAAALGAAIAKALDKLHIKPAQVVMGVPRQWVVLRTLILPAVQDVRELASMVHMQIGKDLPFRQEEAIIDFKVREPGSHPGSSQGGGGPAPPVLEAGNATASVPSKVEVLVAAVKRETVEFYERAAAAAKLKVIALGWLSQANARCVEACGLANPAETVAVVTLRSDEVGIDIVAGSLLFSRGAAIPASAVSAGSAPSDVEGLDSSPAEKGGIEADEAFANAVTIELVRSLHSYNGSESNPPVSKLIVAGVTGCEDKVAEALRIRLKLPCVRLDPLKALDLSTAAREHAEGAIGAIGLGFGVNDPAGLPFDFLNPKRLAVPRNTKRTRMLACGAVAAVLLVTLFGVHSRMMGERLKQSDAIQAELTAAEKKLSSYRSMQFQAAAVQAWANGGRDWLKQYAYLSAVLPGSEDIYVTSLSISGQGGIHLAVQARSGEILASLDRQLRAAGYEVKPLAITPGNDKHGYNFRTTVELIVPAKLKVDLSKALPPARPEDDASLDPKSKTPRKGGRS